MIPSTNTLKAFIITGHKNIAHQLKELETPVSINKS